MKASVFWLLCVCIVVTVASSCPPCNRRMCRRVRCRDIVKSKCRCCRLCFKRRRPCNIANGTPVFCKRNKGQFCNRRLHRCQIHPLYWARHFAGRYTGAVKPSIQRVY